MKVVIIAAGAGSRLWTRSRQRPKTLLPFGEGTILSTIIGAFVSIGLEEFVIVVGFHASEIMGYIQEHGFPGKAITFVENPDWRRGNGLSVLAAADAVGDEPFLLSMSDHIVSPDALRLIAQEASPRNLLLVDPRPNQVFDLPDATKVQVDGNNIIGIGKDLERYNAVDCGIFRLNHRFFAAMRRQARQGVDSISGGVADLIRAGDMEAVVLRPEQYWFDLDTPEAYRHALDRTADHAPGRAPETGSSP